VPFMMSTCPFVPLYLFSPARNRRMAPAMRRRTAQQPMRSLLATAFLLLGVEPRVKLQVLVELDAIVGRDLGIGRR